MDIRVGESRRNQRCLIAARNAKRIYTGIVGCQIAVVSNTCLATGHTVSRTHFQVIDIVVFWKPLFLRGTPCHRYGRESTPAMFLTETAGTVTTNGCSQQIAVFVRVVDTCHVREQCPLCLVSTDGIHFLAIIHFVHIVEHKHILLRIQVVIGVPLGRHTGHQSHTMFFCKSMVE